MMRRFLIQDDVRPKMMAVFYRTVVLYVLLYGSESWVLTKDLMCASYEASCFTDGAAEDSLEILFDKTKKETGVARAVTRF